LRKGQVKVPRPGGSPYIWAGATTLCFLVSFYATRSVLVPLRVLVQVMAVIALVHAYRTVGGIEWMVWLAPVAIELAFWPRFLFFVLFHYAFWYPYWDERAIIYPPLFIAGLLLSRRRYASYLRSASPD